MPRKGYKMTEEQKKLRSKALKGRSFGHKFEKGNAPKNTGRTHFKKGHTPWNKNLTGYTTSRTGQKHSEETKQKRSESLKQWWKQRKENASSS